MRQRVYGIRIWESVGSIAKALREKPASLVFPQMAYGHLKSCYNPSFRDFVIHQDGFSEDSS